MTSVGSGDPLVKTSVGSGEPLLKVDSLRVHFPVRGGERGRSIVKAVDGVSFQLTAGQTLALVGESGCGKSTLAYALLGMVRTTSGQVLIEGRPIEVERRASRLALAERVALVYQDPASALNPKMSVRESIAEPMMIQGWSRERCAARIDELLERVGLPQSFADRKPHALSGGQKQRVVIARALALSPKLLVLDEPVSALDVSIRSQILNLLMALQKDLGLAYVFISHDLSVVRHIADEVLVMYLGTVVEQGPSTRVFAQPGHPYTRALLSAIPLPDPVRQRARARIILSGELPSPLDPPQGCPFVTRCPERMTRCAEERPLLQAQGEVLTACWLDR
jgi:oligopeptide/dipeptide ABC transporter ATP-binding protein